MWKRASNSPQEVQRSCCNQRSWARSQWPAPDQSAGACQRRSSLWWGRSGWGESAQRWEPTSSIPVGFPCFSLQSPLLCSEIHTHTLAYFLSMNYYIVFWNIHTSDLLLTHPFTVFWTTHLLSSLHEILKYTHTHTHTELMFSPQTPTLCSETYTLLVFSWHIVFTVFWMTNTRYFLSRKSFTMFKTTTHTHSWSSLHKPFTAVLKDTYTLLIFSPQTPPLCSERHTSPLCLSYTHLLISYTHFNTHTCSKASLHKLLCCVLQGHTKH